MKYCCGFMEQQLNYQCKQHGPGDVCPDVVIGCRPTIYDATDYYLIARNADYRCNFCPSCGTDLRKPDYRELTDEELDEIEGKNKE